MREYFSEAVVLEIEPQGELDSRFSIFTKRFGKLKARGRSARKILSKLSPHLQPGNLVLARFVEKKGLQVVDALKQGRIETAVDELYKLEKLLNEEEVDLELWNVLAGKFTWKKALAVLGWDPEHAWCFVCGTKKVNGFNLKAHDFSCPSCTSRFNPNEVVLI